MIVSALFCFSPFSRTLFFFPDLLLAGKTRHDRSVSLFSCSRRFTDPIYRGGRLLPCYFFFMWSRGWASLVRFSCPISFFWVFSFFFLYSRQRLGIAGQGKRSTVSSFFFNVFSHCFSFFFCVLSPSGSLSFCLRQKEHFTCYSSPGNLLPLFLFVLFFRRAAGRIGGYVPSLLSFFFPNFPLLLRFQLFLLPSGCPSVS